jgi:hypothetical protein
MADAKVSSLEVIRPQGRIELRDLALAAFYPQTRSTTPLPANTPATPAMLSLQRRLRDNPSPPENVAKPWKKPWEK